MKRALIRFEWVPPEEAPRSYFRRSAAINAGLLAFVVMNGLLKRFELAFVLKMIPSLVVYSLVTNVIYPFWRIRITRR